MAMMTERKLADKQAKACRCNQGTGTAAGSIAELPLWSKSQE